MVVVFDGQIVLACFSLDCLCMFVHVLCQSVFAYGFLMFFDVFYCFLVVHTFNNVSYFFNIDCFIFGDEVRSATVTDTLGLGQQAGTVLRTMRCMYLDFR